MTPIGSFIHWIAAITILAVTGAALASEQPGQLQKTRDLTADAKLAADGRMPIMLLVSQEHCPFCTQIKQEILNPMVLSGDYQGRLVMREMFIDAGESLLDFQGNDVDGSSFALRYSVTLTPTLLFLDPQGRQLTEKMVGIQTPEMYFLYVDASIKEAVAAMRKEG